MSQVPKDLLLLYFECRDNWNLFADVFLSAGLDKQQRAILADIQNHRRVSVRSCTSRGKDYVAAVAAICFLYLTPYVDDKGEFKSTKIVLTAPTGRQIKNIMIPEITRQYVKFQQRASSFLGNIGQLQADGIRFPEQKDWFLTGFKADDNNVEAWSGIHAPNIMVICTEASGISQTTFNAIEGILQGNSRLVLIFNPNVTSGESYNSTRSKLYVKHRLSGLDAPNVVENKIVIPGAIDRDWIREKIDKGWAEQIEKTQLDAGQNDFEFEGKCYRPNDLFRVKVLGEFPKISADNLIPLSWIEQANERWRELRESGFKPSEQLKLGVDVAGMGRDASCLCRRRGCYVEPFEMMQSAGKAEHMRVSGMVVNAIGKAGQAFIDTIGEGAGVFSRLQELGYRNAFSCKYSEGANDLKDVTGVYTFANMRAYLFWAVRDWLNPVNNTGAALPPDDELLQEATEIKWKFQSNGSIIIEPKEDIKKRLGRSPDRFDALANTFYLAVEKKAVDIDRLSKYLY